MKLYKLERFEIMDAAHHLGRSVFVYYLHGKGVLHPVKNTYSTDQQEIRTIEKFLEDPHDRREELKMQLHTRALANNTYLRLAGTAEISAEEFRQLLDLHWVYQKAKQGLEEKMHSLMKKVSREYR